MEDLKKYLGEDTIHLHFFNKDEPIVVISYPYLSIKKCIWQDYENKYQKYSEFSTVIMHAYEKRALGGYNIINLIIADLKKSLEKNTCSVNPYQLEKCSYGVKFLV